MKSRNCQNGRDNVEMCARSNVILEVLCDENLYNVAHETGISFKCIHRED